MQIKICGLREERHVEAACAAGADMIGFVFFPRSPRHITFERAHQLADLCVGRTRRVALCVDADDALLDQLAKTLQPDLLQLHGRETPSRLQQLQTRYRLPMIKALSFYNMKEIETEIAAYEEYCEMILIDAPPLPGADCPGGNGIAFDWRKLTKISHERPLLLSGGLSPLNVRQAISDAGLGPNDGVDVSSGVETALGEKNSMKIDAFVQAVRRYATPFEHSKEYSGVAER